jgi:putative ABC transport system permease protein
MQQFLLHSGYAPANLLPNGSALSREAVTSNTRSCWGGQEALNKGVGDTIELGGVRFRVVGVFESGISWEELGGVITLRDAQALVGRPRKVTMYAVRLFDPLQAEQIVEVLNARFAGEVYASLSGEFADTLPDMEASQGMMDGISAMAILIGGVGVLNTMLMAVMERTREIGVLRALGWRRRAVLLLILQEAVLLGLLGGLAGIGVAFGLLALMRASPVVGPYVVPHWEWDIFVRALLVALFLGVFGGLYPAYRATRLQPVDALRYE